MFFLTNFFHQSLTNFFKSLNLVFDQLKTLTYINPLKHSLNISNPRPFTNFFKTQSLGGDYIFHWNKLAKPSKLGSNSNIYRTVSLPTLLLAGDYTNTTTTNFYLTIFFYFKFFKDYMNATLLNINKTFGFGFYYLRGFFFLLFIDACLTDDEPLWEPIEWSLVQTWILFIFTFAWIAENLIVSRYGSYTGRDKRVWMSWYKTFWLIEGYYAINYGVVCLFVIVPFYYEINYNLSFVYSWWHWYSRVFFFKFICMYSIVLVMSYILQINIRWLNWKKGLLLVLLVNIFISYLIYTHFIMVFFGYFTDPVWYQKFRPVDYIQLSHEPSRWGWGPAKKDHFTYHNVKTVFWFKNDGPFASSFLLFHLFLFVCIFLLFIFSLSLLRKVWAMKELPITFTTYCVSSLKQFFYLFLCLYIFIFLSFIINYMRLPLEFYYFLNNDSWFLNMTTILLDYPRFILDVFSY